MCERPDQGNTTTEYVEFAPRFSSGGQAECGGCEGQSCSGGIEQTENRAGQDLKGDPTEEQAGSQHQAGPGRQ